MFLVRFEIVPLRPFVPGLDEHELLIGRQSLHIGDSSFKVAPEEFRAGPNQRDPTASRTRCVIPVRIDARKRRLLQLSWARDGFLCVRIDLWTPAQLPTD